MHRISQRIFDLMEARGINNATLAKAIGVDRSTLTRWFSTNAEPKASALQSIAEYFGVPISYLYEVEYEGEFNKLLKPVYNVSAGEGAYNGEYTDKVIDETEKDDEEMDYSLVEVHGDSMYPDIHDGDILTVCHQYETLPTDFTVVKIDGEHATVKYVEKTDTGIWLRAINKEVYEDRFYSVQDILTLPVTIIGKVVKVERNL